MNIHKLSRDAKRLHVLENIPSCSAAILDENGGWDGMFDGRPATRTRSDADGRRWPVCADHAAGRHVWAGGTDGRR